MLLLTASGCGSVFEDEYYYEEPFSGEIGTLSSESMEIRNLSMLKTAITGMISRHEVRGDFRMSNYKGNPSEDLAAACYEIKSSNPLGVYAVETLSYETNYVVSYYTATVYITYKRSAEEIGSVQYVGRREELDRVICETVDSFAPEFVFRIYSPDVDNDYIRELVKRHCYDDPVSVIREPVVTVDAYPADGANRIYDVRLDFDLPLLLIPSMTRELDDGIRDAAAQLTETESDQAALALAGAEYLSALCAGDVEIPGTYRDTAYGAFVEHDADSKGFALAFRALCAAMDVECIVVEGSVGGKGGEPHFWNIIGLDGAYYHADVSAFADGDPAAAFLLNDDALWGTYLWDTETYPSCDGTLSYADLMPPEEPAVELTAPGETGDTPEEPGEPEPPADTEPEVPPPEEENEGENGILP